MVYIRFCNVTWPFVHGYAISNQNYVWFTYDFVMSRGRSYAATPFRINTLSFVHGYAISNLHVAVRTRLRDPVSLHVVIRTRLFELR